VIQEASQVVFPLFICLGWTPADKGPLTLKDISSLCHCTT
jgi:hypothetical protein